MASPNLLCHGFLVGSLVDLGSNLRRSCSRNDIPPIVCGGSPLVVEVILELCNCRVLPFPLQSVVLGQPTGPCWIPSSDGVLDLHEYDFGLLRSLLWQRWRHH